MSLHRTLGHVFKMSYFLLYAPWSFLKSISGTMLQLGSKFAQTMLMHRISCWDKNNLQPDTGEPVSLVLLNWLIQWGLQLLTYSLQYVVCRSFKGRNGLVNSGILARNQRKALLPTLLCLNQYIEP